jgi:hypothetical protein
MYRRIMRSGLAVMSGLLWAVSAVSEEKPPDRWPSMEQLKTMGEVEVHREFARIFNASKPEERYALPYLADLIHLAHLRLASIDPGLKSLFERLTATQDFAQKFRIADCLAVASAIGDPGWIRFHKGAPAAAAFLKKAVGEFGLEASRKAFAEVSFANGWPKDWSNRSQSEKSWRLKNQRLAMFQAMSTVWIDQRLNELSAKRASLPQCPPFAGEVPKGFADRYGPDAVASFKEVVRVHDWIRDIRMKNGMDDRDDKKRKEAKQVDYADADFQQLMDDFFADPGSVPIERLMRFRQKPENTDVTRWDVGNTQDTLIQMVRLHNADLTSIVGEMADRSGDGVVVRPGWALERALPSTGVNLDIFLAALHLPLVAQFDRSFFWVVDGPPPFRDAAVGVRVALAVERTMPAAKGVVWKWIEAERRWEWTKIERVDSGLGDPLDGEWLLLALFSYVAMKEPPLPEELVEAIQAAITRRYRVAPALLQLRLMQKMAVRYCPEWEALAQELRKSPFDYYVSVAEQTMKRWGRPFVPTPPRAGPKFDIRVNGERFDPDKLPEPDEFGQPRAQWEANLEVDAPPMDGKPWPFAPLQRDRDGIPGLRDESVPDDGFFNVSHDNALTLLQTGKPLHLVLRPQGRDLEALHDTSLGETSFAVPWAVVPVKLAEEWSKTSVIEVTTMRLAVEVKIPDALRGQLFNTVLHLNRLDAPLRKRWRGDLPSTFRVPERDAYVFSQLQPGRYSLRIDAQGGGTGNGAAIWENTTIVLAPGKSVVTAELQPAHQLIVSLPWPGTSAFVQDKTRRPDLPERVIGQNSRYDEPMAVLERGGVEVPNIGSGYSPTEGQLVFFGVPAGRYQLRVRSSREILESALKARKINGGTFSKHWAGTTVEVEVLANSANTTIQTPIKLPDE